MRNLKKFLAVVVAIAVMMTAMLPAFAEETAATTIPADAKILADLNILQGSGDGVTPEYLAKTVDRMQAARLFLRLKGLEAEALKTAVDAPNFPDADKTNDDGKKIMAYLKANADLGFGGYGSGNFGPTDTILAQQYYKILLTAMGYKQDVDFKYSETIEFAASVGLSKVADVTEFDRADFATATVEALKAKPKGSDKTVADLLVAAGKIDAKIAADAGLTTAPAAKALDLSSAVAINSKVIQVSLATAATAADIAAKDAVTVKSDAGTASTVNSVVFAPWDTANKTLLVTLAADTAVGSYYTVTCGTKTANFGGKAVDTTLPTVTGVVSNDYNEIQVTFSEAVDISKLVVTAAEYYTATNTLTLTNPTYVDATNVKFTTTAQKAELYKVSVSGAADYAANTMTADTAQTFQGKALPTGNQTVSGVYGVDSKTVYVVFSQKVDPTTAQIAANYAISEYYTPANKIEVASAAVDNTDTHLAAAGNATTDTMVTLTLKTDTKAELYKLTTTNVKSKYNTALAADQNNTFQGIVVDTIALTTPTVTSTSNTTVDLDFNNDNVDPATLATMFTITDYYTGAALAISGIKVTDDVVTLTTAAQSAVLYKIVVKAGIKDAKLNATTADLTATFQGSALAAAISSVTPVLEADNTTLTLTFDVSVGSNATDVSRYTIDGGVGYPTAAATVTGSPKVVKLTIPKTTDGTIYTLTVKGLTNADGVAMASTATVTNTFVGRGVAAGLPTVLMVGNTDKQTLKVYFDKAVADSTIDGKFWNSGANTLVSGAIQYSKDDATGTTFNLAGSYVYQDPSNAKVLIIRTTTANAFVKGTAANLSVKIDAAKATNTAVLPMAASTVDPVQPTVVGVTAINKKTIRVLFSIPMEDIGDVTKLAIANAKIVNTSGTEILTAGGATVDVTDIVKVSDTSFDLILDNDLDTTCPLVSNGKAYVEFPADATINNSGVNAAKVQDITGTYALKEDSTGAGYTRQLFGVSTVAASQYFNSGVSVTMTNKRTIVVTWPKAMKTGMNVNTNFTIHNAATGGAAKNASDIWLAEYDATKLQTTLYMKNDINTTGSSFLRIASGLVAIDNSSPSDTTTAAGILPLQFATSGTAVPAASIASVAVDDDRMGITVTMDMPVAVGADANGDGVTESTLAVSGAIAANVEFPVSGTTDTAAFNTTVFNTVFKVYAKLVGDSATGDQSAKVVAPVAPANMTIRSIDGKTFHIAFANALAPSSDGYVTTAVSNTSYLFNKNWVATGKADGSTASKKTFGVPATTIYGAPTMLSATLYDSTGAKKNAGVAAVATDYILVTFNNTLTADIADQSTNYKIDTHAANASGTSQDFVLKMGVTVVGDTGVAAGTTFTAARLSATQIKLTIDAIGGGNVIANAGTTPAATDDTVQLLANAISGTDVANMIAVPQTIVIK